MKKKVLIPEEHFGTKIKISDFTHIRAYHACRIEDKRSYIEQGVLPIEKNFAQNKAIAIFSTFGYTIPQIEKIFDKVWDEYFSPNTPPHVYSILDPNDFRNGCGHYLIFGSEVLSAVAYRLGKDECRNKLRDIGEPTILGCDVQIDQILKDSLTYIEDAILKGNVENIELPVGEIPPQDIVSFMFPEGEYKNPYNPSEKVCFQVSMHGDVKWL